MAQYTYHCATRVPYTPVTLPAKESDSTSNQHVARISYSILPSNLLTVCGVCLGGQVEDTEAFASRVQRAMAKTLSLNSMELLEEAEIPDEVTWNISPLFDSALFTIYIIYSTCSTCCAVRDGIFIIAGKIKISLLLLLLLRPRLSF